MHINIQYVCVFVCVCARMCIYVCVCVHVFLWKKRRLENQSAAFKLRCSWRVHLLPCYRYPRVAPSYGRSRFICPEQSNYPQLLAHNRVYFLLLLRSSNRIWHTGFLNLRWLVPPLQLSESSNNHFWAAVDWPFKCVAVCLHKQAVADTCQCSMSWFYFTFGPSCQVFIRFLYNPTDVTASYLGAQELSTKVLHPKEQRQAAQLTWLVMAPTES